MPVLIMFRSLTYAQRSARLLEHNGISAPVIKAPQGTTDQGCSYCIRLPAGKLLRALAVLDTNRIGHGRILQQTPDGGYQEVGL